MSLNLHLRCGKKVFDLFQTPTEVSINASKTNNYYNVYVDYCVTHELGGSSHFEDLYKFVKENPMCEWSVW